MGIQVLPPDINRSESGFTIEGTAQGQAIRFGMAAIKNVSSTAIESIAAARRDGGAFRNIDDFCHRVDLRTLNKRVLECLIKAGAMDSLGTRGQLLAALDKMISFGQQAQRAAAAGQTSLFDYMPVEAEVSSIALPDVPDAEHKEKLAWEKDLMGLYISSHPAEQATLAMEDQITAYSDQLSEELAGQQMTMVGVVASVRQVFTKKKDTMLVAQIEDIHGAFELVAFPRTYKKYQNLLKEDAVLVIKGKLDARGDDRVQIICDQVAAFVPPQNASPQPAGSQGEAPALAGNGHGLVNGNGVKNGNGHTNGNGNGYVNGHTNGFASGYANSQMNGHTNGNGGQKVARNGNDGGRRHLHLTVRRSEDPDADIERFRQAYALLYANKGGQDSVDLTIAANGHEAVDLEFPDLRVRYTQRLHEQIVSLLGPNSLDVADLAH
jgi:DNA polymerase-3 subunit alpha